MAAPVAGHEHRTIRAQEMMLLLRQQAGGRGSSRQSHGQVVVPAAPLPSRPRSLSRRLAVPLALEGGRRVSASEQRRRQAMHSRASRMVFFCFLSSLFISLKKVTLFLFVAFRLRP